MEPRNLTQSTHPAWMQSHDRDAILAAEQTAAAAIVSNIFGYHGLSFSPMGIATELLQQSQTLTNHDFSVDHYGRVSGEFLAAVDEMPIQDSCCKLLVVQHVHEMLDARHFLAELVRILEPAGYLLLLCDRPRITDFRSLFSPNDASAAGQYRPRQIRSLMQHLGLQHVLTRAMTSQAQTSLLGSMLDYFRCRQYLVLFKKEHRQSSMIRKQQFAKSRLKGQHVASFRTGDHS